MGHFLSDLVICQLEDGKTWEVREEFDYDIGAVGGEKIVVPKGFKTDLGSVPQIFWNIVPPIGKPLRGYIIHDLLYAEQQYTRAISDAVLLEAMEVAGVGILMRTIIYMAVRLGGWKAWNQHAEENLKKQRG